jgi:hypothetical protein
VDRQALFETWAPPGAAWSAWAKPVLFAHLPRPLPQVEAPPAPDLAGLPPGGAGDALVVELPGVRSVFLGVQLARLGYRPVPLFNGCPPPLPEGPPGAREAAVDVESILAALARAAPDLAAVLLPAAAPPAFLLDADRRRPPPGLGSSYFDNRSYFYSTDVPGAATLVAHGVRRVIVVTAGGEKLQADLLDVLREWEAGDLRTARYRLDRPGRPEELLVGSPRPLVRLWRWLTVTAGLIRRSDGGYGGFVSHGG